MSKNICFVNTTKAWGGGEKWHYDIATRLAEKAYTIFIVTNKDSELAKKVTSRKIQKFEISISNLSFLNPFKIAKLKNWFKENKIDTVILNLPSDLKAAGVAAKKAGVKNIIYRRGSAIPIKNSSLNRKLFKEVVTCVIANSEETKKTILANNPTLIDKSKIHVIYNGIDIQEFDKLDSSLRRGTTKQSFEGLLHDVRNDENCIILGNIGRIVEQKNQTFLIDVAKYLKEKSISFKMLIGGTGKLEQELKEKVKALNLEKEIIFTGFVSDSKSFLNSIDVFVLPSLWEGFGYVLAEAMLCEKPSICFNLSSNPELIKNNINGFLTKKNHIEEFAEKIIYYYKNPETISIHGKKGREMALEKFDIKRTLSQVEELLH